MFNFGAPRMADIAPTDLQKRLETGEKLRVIDVRDPWEYAEGHIPGSVLRPLGQIRTWADEFPKDEEIVVYCRSASRSAMAWKYLQSAGYKQVKNMSGGIITWRGQVER